MKTWDVLKATYLIALLHISNENTSYLFERSRYIKYIETLVLIKPCYVALRGIRLISYSCQTRSGTTFFAIRRLDSLMIGNILATFEKEIYVRIFFQGNDLSCMYELLGRQQS